MQAIQQAGRRSAPGWVYVMETVACSGMVKVGCTTRTPVERAAELSRSTGVPMPFVVVHGRPVSDCLAVERAAHRMLADVRVSDRREFFACTTELAISVVDAVADAFPARKQLPFRPFPRKTVVAGPVACQPTAFKPASPRPGWKRRRGTLGQLRAAWALGLILTLAAVGYWKPDVSGVPIAAVRSTLILAERIR